MDIYLKNWMAFDDVAGQGLTPPPEPQTRQTDPLAQAATHAVGQLLRDTPAEACRAMGLIIGTTLGSLEQDRRFDESRRLEHGRYASPAAFTRTLPSTIASELSIRFGIGGPVLVVSVGGASTLLALVRAVAWLRNTGLENCLAGGLDWLGPGVVDETGTDLRERCRGVLCLLSRTPSPGARRITSAILAPARPHHATHIDSSLLGLTEALRRGVSGEIMADSGDGTAVSLWFGDQ